jgi:hypothetical protein
VFEVMRAVRPEIVYHAAALKHLPLLELHPGEALKTNVHGTLHLLEASLEVGVERFVNVSTDKAADPTSVLGYTKRITERLTAWAAGHDEGTYLSVRFGNVLGSRGSLLSIFQAQIAAGGPVTVTHPEVTRFFMTVEEAVQLVLQATVIGLGGEALVFDMGAAASILDLAQRLTREAPERPEIVFTGLRRGEKLHETLLGKGETDVRPFHPLISHTAVPPLRPALLRGLEPMAADSLSAALAALCGADHDSEPNTLSDSPANDGYLVIAEDGHIVAMSTAPVDWLHVQSWPAGDATFEVPAGAQHADGSAMPPEEHPAIATRSCGKDFSNIICSAQWHDGEQRWLECSSRIVSFGDHRTVVVEFRPIAWDPDPILPAVEDAMARVRDLRRALRDTDR